MKKIALSAAVLALLSMPAFAQVTGPSNAPAQRNSGTAATSGSGVQVSPPASKTPGFTKGNDVYDCTGKYLGTDPDPQIRLQLYREGDKSCQGN